MGSKGRVPSHHMRSLPGPDMLHPDLMVPSGFDHRPPGAFPFDMLPPPEIMEQKLAVQQEDMQRIFVENKRLVTTHLSLRQELAVSQQELQRVESHTNAMKADQEQQMRMLLDKGAKMESDLQNSEPVKVEYQKACAEAQRMASDRQELLVKAQQLSQDLQKIHGSVQEIPTLMAELESLRQEYQHYRSVYDYEKKLFTEHYESLQEMESNYMSMVREVEKLRAQLTNATSLERSGGVYASHAAHKENDASGHHSVGQISYGEGYGVSQVHSLPIVTAVGPPVAAPAKSGYDASRGPGYEFYDASRNAGNNISGGASYDAPKAGSYEMPRVGVYNATPKGAVDAQPTVAAVPGKTAGSSYGSGQAVNPYAAVHTAPHTYGSGQVSNPYGSAQTTHAYGSGQVVNPYGSAQTTHTYGSGQVANPYGSVAQTTPPPYGSGPTPTRTGAGYEAPQGRNVAHR